MEAWQFYSSTHPYLGAYFIRKVGFWLPRGTDEYEAAMEVNAVLLEDGVVIANKVIEPGEEIFLKCPALLREDEIAALVANTANRQVQAAAELREMIEEDCSDDNGTHGALLCRVSGFALPFAASFTNVRSARKCGVEKTAAPAQLSSS
jgi:hypothetical protein